MMKSISYAYALLLLPIFIFGMEEHSTSEVKPITPKTYNKQNIEFGDKALKAWQNVTRKSGVTTGLGEFFIEACKKGGIEQLIEGKTRLRNANIINQDASADTKWCNGLKTARKKFKTKPQKAFDILKLASWLFAAEEIKNKFNISIVMPKNPHVIIDGDIKAMVNFLKKNESIEISMRNYDTLGGVVLWFLYTKKLLVPEEKIQKKSEEQELDIYSILNLDYSSLNEDWWGAPLFG